VEEHALRVAGERGDYFSNSVTSMPLRVTIVVVWTIAALPVASRAALLDMFRAEYPDAAARLNAAYSHVSIRTTEKRWNENGNFLWSESSEYLREGDLVRHVQTILRSNYADMPDGTVRSIGGSTEKFFNIRKRPGQNQFVFTDFGPKSRDDFAFKVETECVPLFAPCYGDGADIAEFVHKPNVKLVSARAMTLDGADVVEIVADSPSLEGLHVPVHLYFLPRSWAFAGWTATVGTIQTERDPHQVIELRIAYTGGDPLKLKSIHRWGAMTGDPQRRSERIISVDSIQFEPIPKREFTLAALGVEEPTIPSKRRNVLWFFAINGIILIALLGGVWFHVLSRRRARTVRPPPHAAQ